MHDGRHPMQFLLCAGHETIHRFVIAAQVLYRIFSFDGVHRDGRAPYKVTPRSDQETTDCFVIARCPMMAVSAPEAPTTMSAGFFAFLVMQS